MVSLAQSGLVTQVLVTSRPLPGVMSRPPTQRNATQHNTTQHKPPTRYHPSTLPTYLLPTHPTYQPTSHPTYQPTCSPAYQPANLPDTQPAGKHSFPHAQSPLPLRPFHQPSNTRPQVCNQPHPAISDVLTLSTICITC